MSKLKEKLNSLAKDDSNNWIEKAKLQIENELWLEKSAKIALKILRHIRENNILQNKLAEDLNVSPQQISKILKGQENLTIETISKFETVLGISLIEIPLYQKTFDYVTPSQDMFFDYNKIESSPTTSIPYLNETPVYYYPNFGKKVA